MYQDLAEHINSIVLLLGFTVLVIGGIARMAVWLFWRDFVRLEKKFDEMSAVISKLPKEFVDQEDCSKGHTVLEGRMNSLWRAFNKHYHDGENRVVRR